MFSKQFHFNGSVFFDTIQNNSWEVTSYEMKCFNFYRPCFDSQFKYWILECDIMTFYAPAICQATYLRNLTFTKTPFKILIIFQVIGRICLDHVIEVQGNLYSSSNDRRNYFRICVCHVSQWKGRETITITSLSPVSGLLDASCHSSWD